MLTTVLALVLAAGSLSQPASKPAQPTPTQPTPTQPTSPAAKLDSASLLDFADRALIPTWATKPEDRNAALAYLSAIIEFPAPVRDAVRELDWTAMGAELDAAKLPQAFADTVKLYRDNSNHWSETTAVAASRQKCAFELSYENGFGMLMPQLSSLRNLARGLRFEARLLATEGKYDEAAARLATTLRIGAHATNDRVLISSLVGVAIARVAVDETRILLAAGKVSPAAAAALREAVAFVKATDGFAARAAIETERDMFTEWFRLALAQSDKTPEAVLDLLGEQRNDEVAAKLRAMSADELRADTNRAQGAYTDVAAAWDQPDAAARLEVINTAVARGEYGFVASLLMPSFVKSHQSTTEAVAMIDALDAKLAEIARNASPAAPASAPAPVSKTAPLTPALPAKLDKPAK